MKEDTKAKLIKAGAEIMHLKGYNNTGVKEVLDRAGIPKGSFYNFFRSKEDFGLQVIDYHVGFFFEIFAKFLADEAQPPLERIRLLLEWFMDFFKSTDYTLGCPIGNFAQELGDISPVFREKLKSCLDAMAWQFAAVLEEAQGSGALTRALSPREAAGFMVASWEGALVLMKVMKSTEPLETHLKYVFDFILKG
jgi:TetR/AcrR family transcriptional regulator, transcriptional repressor for nem operon